MVVAMLLVAAAVGFCPVDGAGDAHATSHHHAADHHGMSVDLCAGLAIVSVAVTMSRFAQLYPLPLDAPYAITAVTLHRLDPPPRSRSLS